MFKNSTNGFELKDISVVA